MAFLEACLSSPRSMLSMIARVRAFVVVAYMSPYVFPVSLCDCFSIQVLQLYKP